MEFALVARVSRPVARAREPGHREPDVGVRLHSARRVLGRLVFSSETVLADDSLCAYPSSNRVHEE